MAIQIELTPQFEPLRMNAECALPGEKPFDPVVAQSGSTLVAGGSRAIAIFALQGRPSVLRTIPSRLENGIAGFCVNHSELYVQDGPVLAAWSLTSQKMSAARNLSTGQVWWRDEDATQEVPPDEFYAFSDEDAPLYAKLTAARNRHAWATVLEDLEQHVAMGNAQANAAQTADRVRGLLKADGDTEQVVAETRAELERTLKSVSKIVYSAPVVRKEQRYGVAGAMLFSLGLDGTVYAMDVELRSLSPVNRGLMPLRAELAVGEWTDASNAYSCRLYYVTDDGGIAVLDGATPNLDQRTGWPGKGKPAADKVLPLSGHGKWLMGGGLFGADFFVTEANSSASLAQIVAAPPGGWVSYEVDEEKKFVLLSNGTSTRLHAYDASAIQRDRWQLRQNSLPVQVGFLPTGASDAPQAVVEIDAFQSNDAPLGLRVLLANSVDVSSEARPSGYPPPAVVLATGTIKDGAAGTFPIRWIRSRPTLAGEHLYCMVRTTRPQAPRALVGSAEQLGAHSDHSLSAIPQQVEALTQSGMLRAEHLPAPQAVDRSEDALAKFVFHADKLRELRASATQALKEMVPRTIPVRVKVELIWTEGSDGFIYTPVTEPTVPLRGEHLKLKLASGGERDIWTDENGVATIDATVLDGASQRCQATVHFRSLNDLAQRLKDRRSGGGRFGRTYTSASASCNSVTLDKGTTPVITVEVSATYRSGR
ncbi:hypothetical protein [Trinickia fusca]|uniref:Uncharacterized protein n=1 Tax=Trinickia fusca TaxID=2419777 RepID=A0A494XIP2_9BURK|nr:hypothetical protein [Trinickia fusca]RKP47423.1 hypothetical protein D7S89_14295 [Trinickia fusca]